MNIFKDVPMFGVFSTGPGDILFIKVSDIDMVNVINLTDRQPGWVPDKREVEIIDMNQNKLVVRSRWS